MDEAVVMVVVVVVVMSGWVVIMRMRSLAYLYGVSGGPLRDFFLSFSRSAHLTGFPLFWSCHVAYRLPYA